MTDEHQAVVNASMSINNPSSPRHKNAICEVTAHDCAEEFNKRLHSVVLTGSMARDEATWVGDGEYRKVLGDAEFLLVFKKAASLPSVPAIELMKQRIEDSLRRRGLLCHVGLSAVHPIYFRRLPPSIFAYELMKCGQVVWGDPTILALAPAFRVEDIPREDAWRLLANRMIELLEVVSSVPCNPFPAPYSAVKLYLDMATSLLVFTGGYEPTYQGRARALRLLCTTSNVILSGKQRDKAGRFPFDLETFSRRVSACTALKLGQDSSVGDDLASEPNGRGNTLSDSRLWNFEFRLPLADTVRYAHQLWRWELTQLTGAPEELSDDDLMTQCLRLQPLPRRLRGWLVVLRECGWHRSWRQWPHWMRLGWQASPRYWVYAALSQLFFRLPSLLNAERAIAEADSESRRLMSWLPMPGTGDRGERTGKSEVRKAWQRLGADIAWNYHRFLEGTRS